MPPTDLGLRIGNLRRGRASQVVRTWIEAEHTVEATTQAIRPRVVSGTEFGLLRSKPEHLFGSTKHRVTKTERVQVSDLERLR